MSNQQTPRKVNNSESDFPTEAKPQSYVYYHPHPAEEGTWLKSTSHEDMIVRVDEFMAWGVNGGMRATGINGAGDWKENHLFGTHHCRRATDEEVEQALVGFIHRAIQL